MTSDWQRLIEHLQTTGRRVLLASFGDDLAELARSAPCGAASLETLILSDAQDLANWLSRAADEPHSADTALSLATTAYWRLMHPSADANSLIGVGVVVSHGRAASSITYLATQTARETRLYAQGAAAGGVLDALRDIAGCREVIDAEPARASQRILAAQPAPTLLADVWIGTADVAWSLPDGTFQPKQTAAPAGILSGSFNPLHEGHLRLRDAAEAALGGAVCFELALWNADKPRLDYISIERRRMQFRDHPLVLTRAATFVDKAALFPEATFVVGIDTAERVVEPRFYGGSAAAMAQALEAIRGAGCRFLVAGRSVEGRFRRLSDMDLPRQFADLFEELPESKFRLDASSTSLRRAGGRGTTEDPL